MLHKRYLSASAVREHKKHTHASVPANKPVSNKIMRRESLGSVCSMTLIVSTNSGQSIAFLKEPKLNIALHDAPPPWIAVGELLIESVLAAGIPPRQPILARRVIVIIVADEHFFLSHAPFPFCRGDSRLKILGKVSR